MKKALLLGLSLVTGLFSLPVAAGAAVIFDNLNATVIGSQDLLQNNEPSYRQSLQFVFSTTTGNILLESMDMMLQNTNAYPVTVTATLSNALPGSVVWYATTTLPASQTVPTTTTFPFFYFSSPGVPVYGAVLVSHTTNTFTFLDKADMVSPGDRVAYSTNRDNASLNFQSQILKRVPGPDFSLVPFLTYGVPRIRINGIQTDGLPPNPATPGIDPFQSGFLTAYGLQSTSSIAILQAQQASVTSTCPDLFLLHGACEFAAWLFIPDLADLSTQLSIVQSNLSVRLPFSWVVGMWDAVDDALEATTSTSFSFSFVMPATHTSIITAGAVTTSKTLFIISPSSSAAWIGQDNLDITRTAEEVFAYFAFALYAMNKARRFLV